ncbi:MAG: hypothetical protein ACK4OE_05635 [Acidovorax sp.]|uniref:hypothetical protein n=1 Tax=Acidovorax sp. TaxID=1872122 RepID=UPI00391CD7B4
MTVSTHIDLGAGTSSFFSAARFLHLSKAQWAEQRRQYLGHMLVVGMLAVVVLLFMLVLASGREFPTWIQQVLYLWGLFFTGFVFAARYFEAMARRESALLTLMRPASVFEKWLLCVLVVAVLYPLCYSLLFLAFTWPVRQIVLAIGALDFPSNGFDAAKHALFVPMWPHSHDSSVFSARQQVGFLIALWALQALAVAGSLYFRRAAMLKTMALVFVLFLMTILVSATARASGTVLLAWWSFSNTSVSIAVHAINATLWLVLPLLLWLQAYLHLRDKELS